MCRLLVALLLFNIVTPMAMADSNDPNTVLICTTAGLIEVNVDDFSSIDKDGQTQKTTQTAQHCSFCSLHDTDVSLDDNHLSYPSPDSRVSLHYQSVLTPPSFKSFAKHSPLRAPPVYL